MNENKEDLDNQNDDQSSAASNINLNLKENLFGSILKMSGKDQNGNSDKKVKEINNDKYNTDKVNTCISNNENKESNKKPESEILNHLTSEMFPKFFMKVLDNIKKEKGLNIFNSFEYIINALIHMHFQRKEKAQTSKVNQFIEKFNLEKEPANEKVFITFMESFPEFNFFE